MTTAQIALIHVLVLLELCGAGYLIGCRYAGEVKTAFPWQAWFGIVVGAVAGTWLVFGWMVG